MHGGAWAQVSVPVRWPDGPAHASARLRSRSGDGLLRIMLHNLRIDDLLAGVLLELQLIVELLAAARMDA